MIYNVVSVALGLSAWILGICAILRQASARQIFGSLLCCTGALLSQLLNVKRLVSVGDWAALLDTADVVILAAAVLTAVTAVLNAIALLHNKK